MSSNRLAFQCQKLMYQYWKLYGRTYDEMAEMFGVSKSQVPKILDIWRAEELNDYEKAREVTTGLAEAKQQSRKELTITQMLKYCVNLRKTIAEHDEDEGLKALMMCELQKTERWLYDNQPEIQWH